MIVYFSEIGCKFPKGIEAIRHSFISKVTNLRRYAGGYAPSIEKESPRKVPTNFKGFTDFNNCHEL